MIIGFGKSITFVTRLFKRDCTERFLDTFSGIEVCELSRYPASIPPDTASLFEIWIILDAPHDVDHWPQFGLQFPVNLDKETQTKTIISFDFNTLRDCHFERNGASDAPRNRNIVVMFTGTYRLFATKLYPTLYPICISLFEEIWFDPRLTRRTTFRNIQN